MPDIEVKGIGVLSFPDSMSDADIEKAIKEHPEYPKARDKANFKPLVQPPEWLTKFLGKPEDSPMPGTVAREIGKGIPGIGHFIPQNSEMASMEKNWPIATGLARGTGAVGSMIAPSIGVSSGLVKAGFPGLLPEIAGQATLGAGTSAVDKLAQKGTNVSSDEIIEALKHGGAWGAAGPIAGKMISPAFNSNRYTNEQLAKFPEEHLEKMLRPTAAKETARAILEHPITTAAGGAGLAAISGVHPGLGAAAGFAAPYAVKGAHALASNKMMHNPDTQAILNILMQAQGQQLN